MVNIFLCDDDANFTEYLKFCITKHYGKKFRITIFNSCNDLINAIEAEENVPDILIMDINLKDGNGIDTVERLQRKNPQIKVIYFTGLISYATAIFKTNPSYFLVKPLNENKLCEAIDKVFAEVTSDKDDSIIIKSNGSEIVLFHKDIIFLESQGRKVKFHLNNGEKKEVYTKIDDIQKELGKNFVRSHKSFLINMQYITERTNNEFFLMDGSAVPISKPNLKEAKTKFISYLGELE